MSDTKKSLPQFLLLHIKGHYSTKKKLSGFNDNYLVILYDLYNYMIYIIIIKAILV